MSLFCDTNMKFFKDMSEYFLKPYSIVFHVLPYGTFFFSLHRPQKSSPRAFCVKKIEGGESTRNMKTRESPIKLLLISIFELFLFWLYISWSPFDRTNLGSRFFLRLSISKVRCLTSQKAYYWEMEKDNHTETFQFWAIS